MFTHGDGSNGLAIIFDSRTKDDAERGEVRTHWAFGQRALGRNQWARTLKIALREFGTAPYGAEAVRSLKPAVMELLQRHRIRAVLISQSPTIGGVKTGTNAWNVIGRPGAPYKWAGTVITEDGLFKCPVLHPQNYEHAWSGYDNSVLVRWYRQALALARGAVQPLPWPELVTVPNRRAIELLQAICDKPQEVAIDIETNMGGGFMTALGVGFEGGGISIPWDEYQISGTTEIEPALLSYELGPEIRGLARELLESKKHPKIFHNGAFDLYQLGRWGLPVSSFDYDTMLMHRVAYPHYRHGLQFSCATEFAVNPWKLEWKPPKKAKGHDIWLSDPGEMRIYNAKDSYATWLLCQALKLKVGL